MGDEFPRFCFGIGQKFFVGEVVHRHEGAPVRHQPLVLPPHPPEVVQARRIGVMLGERLGEHGQAGIARIARAQHQCRARPQHPRKAEQRCVQGMLVRHAPGFRRERAAAADEAFGKAAGVRFA